jgi:hypothetical protein
MTNSPFADLKVQKVGLLYDPPSILVEYVASPVSPFETLRANVSKEKSMSSKIECSFGKTDLETFKKSLVAQFPQFFGRESGVSEDQLNRILSMLLEKRRMTNPTTDLFEKNRIQPDSDCYVYDKRREFEAPIDECSWD